MKQFWLTSLFTIGIVIGLSAQTYLKPKYAARALKSVEITKIQITKKYTIVSFHFKTGKGRFEGGGWIALDKNMYIKNAN